MRNMDSLESLWQNTLQELFQLRTQQTSRDGDVVGEIIGFSAEINHPFCNVVFNPVRKFSLSYACAEVLWYLSGTNSIEMIKAYAPQYERFSENGKAYGSYGYRWENSPGFKSKSRLIPRTVASQLHHVIKLLYDKPDSRQVIMTCWDSGDLIHAALGDHKDLPCTLALQFLIRDDQLNLVVTMRSNDAWLGLPYDVFAFTMIQALVAAQLGKGLGHYWHQSGSEHLYQRNFDKACEAARCMQYTDWSECSDGDIVAYHRGSKDLQKDIEMALRVEQSVREDCWKDDRIEQFMKGRSPILHDLVLGCAMKWTAFDPILFNNVFLYQLAKESYREAGYKVRTRDTH